MNKTMLQFAAAGFASGILSSWVSGYIKDVWFTPGVVFGVITGLVITFLDRKITFAVPRFLAWVIVSTGSYYVAVLLVLYITKGGWIGFFIGGGTGAVLLFLGLYLLFYRFSIPTYASAVLLGALLGLSGYVNMQIGNARTVYGFSLPFLYVIWQTGIAGAIGYVASKEQ